jgi:hypothetical protein
MRQWVSGRVLDRSRDFLPPIVAYGLSDFATLLRATEMIT